MINFTLGVIFGIILKTIHRNGTLVVLLKNAKDKCVEIYAKSKQ